MHSYKRFTSLITNSSLTYHLIAFCITLSLFQLFELRWISIPHLQLIALASVRTIWQAVE